MSQQLSAGVSLALAQRGGGGQPSLALNFLTEQLDSRITFSRGTQAMRYGQDGTLQYAPNNLLTYSNQADNAAWTKSNSFVQTNLCTYSQDFDVWSLGAGVTVNTNTTIAPDGTLTADRVNFATGGAFDFVRKTLALTVGVTYTISVYAISTGGSPTFYFDVGNGGVVQSPNQTPTSTWQRFSYTFVFAGANQWIDIEASAAGSIVFWGGQIVQGSVPGDYRATTSAALPVLYADYNGALRARKLCEDSANALHYIAPSSIAGGFSAGQVYTYSVYAKAGERSRLYMDGRRKDGTFFTIIADLTTGNISTATNVISSGTQNLGNGWWRVYLTTNIQSGAFSESWAIAVDNGIYAGNGSSGIYIADAQLTPGYLPLAVTETTSAAVYGPRLDYDPGTLVTQNLLKYSEQFDNAAWVLSAATVTANSTTAPDGTTTADTITFSSVAGRVQRAINMASQCISIYVKPIVGTRFAINTDGVSGADATIFNLSGSGSVVSTGANNNSSVITALADGWYRIVTARGSTAGTNIYLGALNSGGGSTDSFYIWGAQLNTGATALPYAATTSATVTTCAARGLQLEEQRTNLLTYSNTFSDASWLAVSAKNVAASAVLSPEGVVNAWTLTDSSAVAYEGIQKSVTVAADSATYAASLYVLKTYGGTSSTFGINLQITGGTTVANTIRINTDTGAVLNGTGAVVQNVGAWWRVSAPITNNASVGNTTLTVSLYPATAAYNSGTDSAAATGSATIYQSQLEVGATATSPIVTVGSTGTRNADSMTIPAGTWYNTTAGTWYFNGETQTFPRYVVVDNSGASKYPLYVHSAAGGIGNFDGTNLTLTANNTTAGTTFKAATAYSGSTASAVLNAGTVASGTYNGAFSTIATFKLGGATGAGGEIGGHIRSLTYYRRRLSNTELQRITA